MEDLEGEIWWPIPNHEDYEISNMGRLRTWRQYATSSKEVPVLMCNKNDNDITFIEHGKKFRRAAATMVLEMFSSPRPSIDHLPFHLDGNRKNNKVSNLVWFTKSDAMTIALSRSGNVGPREGTTFVEPMTELDKLVLDLWTTGLYSKREIAEILHCEEKAVIATVKWLKHRTTKAKYHWEKKTNESETTS